MGTAKRYYGKAQLQEADGDKVVRKKKPDQAKAPSDQQDRAAVRGARKQEQGSGHHEDHSIKPLPEYRGIRAGDAVPSWWP